MLFSPECVEFCLLYPYSNNIQEILIFNKKLIAY